MRILLVVPTNPYKFKLPAPQSVADFPIGFPYVTAALKAAGHQVHG